MWGRYKVKKKERGGGKLEVCVCVCVCVCVVGGFGPPSCEFWSFCITNEHLSARAFRKLAQAPFTGAQPALVLGGH
jgi:hypothetical protein